MRRGFGLVGLLATVILLVIVGAIAYNVGWSDGVNTHLPAGTTTPVAGPYYGYGFHPFFAGFGILWFLFILFGIFFLLRLAFFGRMWRGGGWGGYGKGMGHGGGRSGQGGGPGWGHTPPRETPPPPSTPAHPP